MHDHAEEPEGITTAQDKVLSILPIPSAVLSIFGSSVILYMAISTRRQRKWTTYTRLLIGLSVCDIISSVSLAFSPFLRRPESGRVWAVGNDATCTAIGTMTQFSYSNIFFNAMLSYYFLATVRFHMKHSRIAKFLEPWMHFISIGYPLVTSLVGAVNGMYGEKATGMGCWVNEYPRGCGDEPDQEPCTSGTIGWFYLGLPLLFSGFSILINNLIIARYVWGHTKTSTHSTHSRSGARDTLSTSSSSDFATKMDEVSRKRELVLNGHQLRRLRLVSTQAFLFVASYITCTLSLGSLGILEAMTKEANELQLMKDLYWLMVLNAILAPLQGFLNMLVYIRPKYLKNRQDFPLETKLWATRRAIFGQRVRAHRFIHVEEKGEPKRSMEPTKADVGSPSDMNLQMKDVENMGSSQDSVPRKKRVSSITLSNWDQFDRDSLSPDDLLRQSERWVVEGATGDVTNAVPTSRHQSQPHINFQSSISSLGISLPFIAETELLDIDDTSHSSEHFDRAVIISTRHSLGDRQSSEARWGSTKADIGKASQNLDGFNNRQLSSSNHTKDSRWSSSKSLGKASQNQQLSASNHTKSSAASSARLVAPIRRSSEYDARCSEHDGMATTEMWAASLGFQTPASKDDSPMIVPKRLASDCEMVDDTGDTKVVFKRSSVTSPKRAVEADKKAIAKRQISVQPPPPPPPNHSPVPPGRIPTKGESSSHEFGNDRLDRKNKFVEAVLDDQKATADPSSLPLKVPQRLPSDQSRPRARSERKVGSRPNRSPNHSPVAPRRVPTELDDDDNDEFMLE